MFRPLFKLAVPALVAFASPAFAQSGTFTGQYIGCLTQDNLDQLYRAIDSGDKRLRDGLMGKVCVVVAGYDFSILDRGFLTTEVRVYVGGNTVDLIVPSEAVR